MGMKSSFITASDAAPTLTGSEGMELRRATPSDGPGVWKLISGVLAEYGIVANPETTDRDLTDLGAHYDGRRAVLYVLTDAGTVIGTVALRRESEEVCELCRMYLAGDHRGRGLGRRLFDHAVAEARRHGFREVFLKTASVLTTAIALYERAGFRHVPDPKCEGNCDRVMRMQLGSSS
jgi:putative acetyltransferase